MARSQKIQLSPTSMLETSKDLLNLVIAFCVLWLTIFICWLIYYVAMIFRGVNQVIEKFNQTLEAITSFFTKAKEKIENFSSNIGAIIEAAKKVADFVNKRRKSTAEKTKK